MRPALIYPGGKFRLAPWIISFFPRHKVYVEPFGGAAGVMVRKSPSPLEIYNDIDSRVVNYFRVLRDPEKAAELVRKLSLTPYSKEEFDLALKGVSEDPVENARLLAVAAYMGQSAKGAQSRTSFRRAKSHKNNVASEFVRWVDVLNAVAKRMRACVIEHGDALEVIKRYDSHDTLFFVDPPYDGDCANVYKNSFRDRHAELLALLAGAKGFVVLSGYATDLYCDNLAGWHLETRENQLVCLKRYATECLWLSPRTWEALHRERRGLLAL